MTPKERIDAVLAGRPVDRVPVTPIFMAWAANYIGRNYREYYLDGDVLVESQLAMARDFQVDQVSAISDPWREASGYGMEFDYPEDGVGKPRDVLLKSPADIDRLTLLDPYGAARMKQRIDSVAKLAAAVGDTHGVLGWVEGPAAEYVDLRGMQDAMLDLMDRPEIFQRAADVLVENAVCFAVAQVEAGADMIGVGDAAASLIGPSLYERLVLPGQQKLFAAIHRAGARVKLHICGNIAKIVAGMAQSGADIIDVDWMVPLEKARRDVGDDIVLCGNFDPAAVLLQGTPQQVTAAARDCIARAGERFILMPGCEVPPGTPLENLRAFCPNENTLGFLAK
ncbi:MAG: uroporphyrinogen decarboxylase family protein [Sedimentisphaerales bacterium]|nr:uroporphyrinogen decarboxylase family protein [Sedimentisphaerales bacterium]